MSDDLSETPIPEPSSAEDLTNTPRGSRAVDPVMIKLAEATGNEYRVERELGRGGMATVYLAHDLQLDRKVAIKVMGADLFAAGDILVDRFLREARTGARLNHPHIIPVYAIRESKELIYFVMKFIDGKPLDDVIGKYGPLPIALVARVMAQVADALAYAHRNGIVHRDIKPGNIMLDKEGWVVLTDLGIAKVQEASMLTATGSAIGTPTYMSPEQSSGSKETTGASDQYSLGCVAFEMLTGRPPFQADSMIALIFQHHAEPPPPLHTLRSDVPGDMAAAIMKMLAKAPEDRYASMEECAQFFRDMSMGDEEEFRMLLRAFATGTGTAEAAGRVNTPRTPMPTKNPSLATPRPQNRPSRREVAVTTSGMLPVAREFTTGTTPAVGNATIPGGPNSDAAAAAKAAWPRTLIKPPEQKKLTARSFRAPGILTMLFVAAIGWFMFFPTLGDLETTVPQNTALMMARQVEAEAAVRRGAAPGAEGSCEGVRNDLPTCRKQIVVSLDSIAPAMVEATVAATDSLFTARQSADWVAMRRAAGYPRDAFEFGNSVDRSDLFSVMPTLLNRMDVVGHAGSLTQRLVQIVWFPPDNGLFRKAREIRLANRIAGTLSKDRILELYLNVAEFGPGLYGVEAASQAYFSTSAGKLTKAQAATLAATLATPRTSTPLNEPAAMRRRQALILRRLNGEAVSIPMVYAASDSASRAP
jgi:serine/threonine protein kinase